MKNISYYQQLPEILSSDELVREIDLLLLDKDNLNGLEFTCALDELSCRFVDSALTLPNGYKNILSSKIILSWDMNSIESTENCLSIIINFGLKEVMIFLKNKYSEVSDLSVKKELLEFFSEFHYW